ncbi:hypothetical protein [Virgibacillus litoralis]|uniref:Uncharacterized protein n=1 Tax=Virgibacillus litoralis TaxID=578221 RepID=A0ABS4HBS0_9BACI|nr:hypothetical protein [Virgibacillus litoralis]MBP1948355.1 hypothetical protein [Virgibacillus litoralis]
MRNPIKGSRKNESVTTETVKSWGIGVRFHHSLAFNLGVGFAEAV